MLCLQANARKIWRRGSESNRRIKVLQTSPLPLGYRARTLLGLSGPGQHKPLASRGDPSRAKLLERETGFEPATSTLARSHSTTELLPLKKASRDYIAMKIKGQTTHRV